jgi:hypothetical protein
MRKMFIGTEPCVSDRAAHSEGNPWHASIDTKHSKSSWVTSSIEAVHAYGELALLRLWAIDLVQAHLSFEQGRRTVRASLGTATDEALAWLQGIQQLSA